MAGTILPLRGCRFTGALAALGVWSGLGLVMNLGTVLGARAQEAGTLPQPIMEDILHCASLEDDARLRCFDGMVLDILARGRAAAEAPDRAASVGDVPEGAATGQPAGKWIPGSWIDPLDDTLTMTLLLEAEAPSRPGRPPVQLWVRCQEKSLEVFVAFGTRVGRDLSHEVRYRIGDRPARTQTWFHAGSGDILFVPPWAGRILEEMRDEERLVVEAVPQGQAPLIAIFDIRGLWQVLPPLAQACDWTLE